ncbi:DUF6427 family protein [Plebeiibacterium marinum]|uniref:DUF6427 family protein n=1 Tax=Plebeiibacterium marinum TaxID=2992111 RepID=A0AAE3SJT5_9BACT|nr:DUF6427 family protein [Plebeiobacterium marinum]MCW3806090.1 DUF6427 family protein [Plebeiobacterium marinum]
MILKQIHSNKIGAYAFMLLLLITLWVIPFLKNNVVPVNVSGGMPMGDFLYQLNSTKWISLVASFVCILLVSVGITRFNARYGLLNKQSALPAVVFVLLAGSITSIQLLNPVMISSVFIVISLSYLFEAYNYRKTMKECFIAAFALSLGSLFAYKIVLLFPLLIFVMIPLRVLSFKSFLASLIGFVLPWLFVFGYELMWGNMSEYLLLLKPLIVKFSGDFGYTLESFIYFGLIVLLFIASMVTAINELGKKKIFTRKQFVSLIWISVYIVALVPVTGGSVEFITLAAISLSILIAHLINSINSWIWRNIFFFSVVALTVLGQLFL